MHKSIDATNEAIFKILELKFKEELRGAHVSEQNIQKLKFQEIKNPGSSVYGMYAELTIQKTPPFYKWVDINQPAMMNHLTRLIPTSTTEVGENTATSEVWTFRVTGRDFFDLAEKCGMSRWATQAAIEAYNDKAKDPLASQRHFR